MLTLEVKHEILDETKKVDPKQTRSNIKDGKHQPNKCELKHSIAVENNNDTKLFSCKFCQRTFKRRNSLEGHERVHTGERCVLPSFCLVKHRYKF